MLVVSQIAVAVILLVGTGLLLRTFSNLRGGELGFEPARLLTLRTTIPLKKYSKPADRAGFFERVVTGAKALPGVTNAAYVTTAPFGSVENISGFQIEGGNPANGRTRSDASAPSTISRLSRRSSSMAGCWMAAIRQMRRG